MRRTTKTTQTRPSPIELAKGKKRACIIILTGDLRGTRYEIAEGTNAMGRGSEMQVRLPTDEYVSRHHADIVIADHTAKLRDLGSTNGTYVNARKVDEATLVDGDRVQVGTTTMKFLYADDVEAEYLDEMYRLATRDGLTDVYNKRFFLEQLDTKLSEAIRAKQSLGLFLLDLDFFKKINDHYGHVAGDHVLQAFAGLAKSAVRKEDVFARFGGEEFGILAPRLDHEGALTLGEKIRESVERHGFAFDGKTLPVTVSVGVWVGHPETGTTSEHLLKKADDALYHAKHEGRNRCVVRSS